mgnify:FL=1|tara:strand:+ start:2835 stop:3587 length:753 start_codon:yes stop_codon:yes gene_type:complete
MKMIKKIFSFILLTVLSVMNFSCGGGGSSSGNDNIAITTPAAVVDPPSASTLSHPENNKVCETGSSVSEIQSSVEFQWNTGTNADSYDLQIINLETNQTINQNNISGTSKLVTLIKGTPYSWKVISKRNGTSKTATSNTWKFYLSGDGLTNYPPYPAKLISPKSGSSLSAGTTSVELSWEGSDPDGESLTYTLYFDTTDGLQSPLSSNKNITLSSKSVSVSSGKTYYWRIKSTDPNENSSYSLIYTFRVE